MYCYSFSELENMSNSIFNLNSRSLQASDLLPFQCVVVSFDNFADSFGQLADTSCTAV